MKKGLGVAVDAPEGWTEILRTDNDNQVSVISYWKIAGASEPASYTWSVDGRMSAVDGITRYSGVDAGNPVDTAAGGTGNSKVPTAPSISTSEANEEIVAIFSVDSDASFTVPAGMNEKYDVTYGVSGPSTALADALQAAVGATGDKFATTSGSKKRNWAAQQIALRQPSGPPPPPPEITFDNAGGVQISTTDGVSFPVTVGSGQDRMLVVGIDTEDSASDQILSVSFDGVPMSLVTNTSFGSGSDIDEVYLFALPNPNSGTHDVVVTRTATGTILFIAAYATSYENVYQNTPSNFNSSIGAGSLVSNTLNVQGSNSWIVSMISGQGSTPTLTSAGATRVQENSGRILVDTDGIVPIGNNDVTASLSSPQPWGVGSLELKVTP